MPLITIDDAVAFLQAGEVVAIPTETVYGLAASINHQAAITAIFEKKKRPSDNPLIVHVAAVEEIARLTTCFPPGFFELANRFWPGPLTILLEIPSGSIDSVITANQSRCAFRIPSHPKALSILAKTGPLVAPSANLSGKPSTTVAQEVLDDFGSMQYVVDGGRCNKGVESTIVVYEGEWKIIRLGAISLDSIKQTVGNASFYEGSDILVPGKKYKHYAPNCRLFLSKQPKKEIVIGFSDRNYPTAQKVYFLGPSNNPEHILYTLYSTLRSLDVDGITEAEVDVDLPQEGLFSTFFERITRASVR